jgi:hypothetical protein
MGHERRSHTLRLLEHAGEPGGERVVVEPVDGCRLAEPGHVGNDETVALREAGDDRRPVGTAALDTAVQQHERSAVAGFEDGGLDALGVDDP